MKNTAAVLTVMTGLVMASAAFAADQVISPPDQQPVAAAAAPAMGNPGAGMGLRDGSGAGCTGMRANQQAFAQGGRMGMMRGYQQGMGEGRGRQMDGGHAWVAGITVALAWILMVLGIAALAQHLKKNCTMDFSWRKKKEATDVK